jgi:3-oxoacyl-[acyl-carrier-protein] synthase III
MSQPESEQGKKGQPLPFYERPNVILERAPVAGGIPFGVEKVYHPQVGIGGAYGAWGEVINNQTLPAFVERSLGEPLAQKDRLDLSPLGFIHRHHVPKLSSEEHIDLEIKVGARFLQEAARANGWEPDEVDGVFIGTSAPVVPDYTERIAKEAGIPDQALKVSVHKACDGSMGALQLALNPAIEAAKKINRNLALELIGKKLLVGGIEGLSRFVQNSRDKTAYQLFGNGAGIIGIIPGETIKFLVGKAYELFDDQGVLAVRMLYPHSRERIPGQSMIETSQEGYNHLRLAGLMHEPDDDSSVDMAGHMGMVKLFVRNGVQVVRDVYLAYLEKVKALGRGPESLASTIVHHANYKINSLKDSHLKREGIQLKMPWLVSDFGNVSAASNMIAFLRELPSLNPGDHILFDGFGAGTYYDVFAVELGD